MSISIDDFDKAALYQPEDLIGKQLISMEKVNNGERVF